ncbi:MAG: c-type cytochrome [Epsilonproteobacteria bacterium]|nr:c-type cytochrome [Campylobacterota bacterium]OIO13704.1 MAG: cytochrome C [Helicobacteraceae bacterium CG1_02_36_14]PIP10645.1 MAG: cytochrome C [Sulfurimonas sp. CG23_combo_of_CG06-09_8_20_14_all_36_33]PIS25618.1 MAG: cytochrome C [Sulfurimonas sp. CG08_land_8_20_14_0_20_36_33]PIU34925.1 MAG: cytochrome C [Sulfurimonas sp. CG07_land_8_20_14_0_80_36_56]PIV04638.1 MAG: cytochrome C [Sulfurimonas sp. CG03_land_8_20_14_0_80_36_25]PIV36423.1 MAG: cytochrome C [Sulfurimonas sp. CG02_land_8_20_
MNHFFFFILSLFFFTAATSSAAVYKGQKLFVKQCTTCHETGQTFVAKKKMKEWKKVMEEDGKKLATLHLKSEKASKSWKYFESKSYSKNAKHLKQFLVEYAKDSGNVPACN